MLQIIRIKTKKLSILFGLSLVIVNIGLVQDDSLTPKLFAPDIISTTEFEFGGTFTPDGNEFYFTRRPTYEGSDNRIFYSKKVNGEWTKPVRAPFSSNPFEFLPVITPDGKELFFYSERNKPSNMDCEGNIWFCTRQGDGWSEPQYFEYLKDVQYCMMVSVTRNGTLYFAGVFNKKRGVFKLENKNGQYTDPEYLPETINSLRPAHPFIAADESYIIFDTQVTGMGKPELFISFRKSDGTWNIPKNIGSEINATKTEFAGSVTPDEKYFFFHRRINGSGDILYVEAAIINEIKAKVMK